MTWSVITHVGAEDAFVPDLADDEPRILVQLAARKKKKTAASWIAREVEIAVGHPPSPEATDLLTLAVAVYSADLRVPRTLSEDDWTRSFMVHLPVRDVAKWEQARAGLEKSLAFLTGDDWSVNIRERVDAPAAWEPPKVDHGKTCLFSGGLDSLVAAIDTLEEEPGTTLVGHYGAGMTHPVQSSVLEVLKAKYGQALLAKLIYVQPSKKKGSETTMRARSFLFLALGVAVATAQSATSQLIVGENGPISLNVPLTPARMGSLSTRTTHPHFMSLFQDLLRDLSIPVQIELPYRFLTKGEMLRECRDTDLLRSASPLTMSCSHPEVSRYLGHRPGKHCGYCVPCIIRRASLYAAEMPKEDYEFVDLSKLASQRKSDRSRDSRAFKIAIERLRRMTPVEHRAQVLASGPLPSGTLDDFVGVYLRCMNEVDAVLNAERIA